MDSTVRKRLEKVMEKVMRLEAAEDNFNEPVDYLRLGLTTYRDVVKVPMDLGTVQKKLLANKYASPSEFLADVRLVFSNCRLFNEEGSGIVQACAEVEKAFGLEMKKGPLADLNRPAPASVTAKIPKGPRTSHVSGNWQGFPAPGDAFRQTHNNQAQRPPTGMRTSFAGPQGGVDGEWGGTGGPPRVGSGLGGPMAGRTVAPKAGGHGPPRTTLTGIRSSAKPSKPGSGGGAGSSVPKANGGVRKPAVAGGKKGKRVQRGPPTSVPPLPHDLAQGHPMQRCSRIIQHIMQLSDAQPFNRKVTRSEVPDYFDHVKNPMDLGTILERLKPSQDNLWGTTHYNSASHVLEDVRQVWTNCRIYNKPGSEICEMCKTCETEFLRAWAKANLTSWSSLGDNTSSGGGSNPAAANPRAPKRKSPTNAEGGGRNSAGHGPRPLSSPSHPAKKPRRMMAISGPLAGRRMDGDGNPLQDSYPGAGEREAMRLAMQEADEDAARDMSSLVDTRSAEFDAARKGYQELQKEVNKVRSQQAAAQDQVATANRVAEEARRLEAARVEMDKANMEKAEALAAATKYEVWPKEARLHSPSAPDPALQDKVINHDLYSLFMGWFNDSQPAHLAAPAVPVLPASEQEQAGPSTVRRALQEASAQMSADWGVGSGAAGAHDGFAMDDGSTSVTINMLRPAEGAVRHPAWVPPHQHAHMMMHMRPHGSHMGPAHMAALPRMPHGVSVARNF